MKSINKGIIAVLFIATIACKNNAQNTDNTNKTQEILTRLPDELANKTWIYINSNYNESYKTILNYKNWEYLETEKQSINLPLDLFDPYRNSKEIKSISVKNGNYHLKFKDSVNLESAKFKWLNKSKGLGQWEIKYHGYQGYTKSGDTLVKKKSVIKSFVTPENFPELEKELEVQKVSDIIPEYESIEYSNKYDRIEEAPIVGKFSCDKQEVEQSVLLSRKETDLYDSDWKVREVQPYNAIIYLNEIDFVYVMLVCSLRKVKGEPNKYVFLFEHTLDTDESAPDEPFFSKTRPIAEMEVLDNNTIKYKWIGFYNKRTQKIVKDYAGFEWKDKCNSIIKRVE